MHRRALVALAGLLVLRARDAASQDALFEKLNLDKLQITSLGIGYGRILPSQVEPASLFAMSADYGEIVPRWRVVFGVSYWESRYRDAVVQHFIDTLNGNLDDPSGRARVRASRISLYDVTFSAEGRYFPTSTSVALQPFFGVGFAGHVINAEGSLIDGTFVERSLDNVAAGLFVTAGVVLKVVQHFGLEGGVRGDLLSGFRSTQVRAGAAYYFGRIRPVQPPG